MIGGIDLRIAELLASRLCHELVSPVGAISNGLEIMEDEPDFASDAGALIADSARQAACRLQFYRVAYGSTATIADAIARDATMELFAQSKIRCRWADTALPAGWQKLACNLMLLASEALPRGGELRLESDGQGISIVAMGEGARFAETVPALIDRMPDAEEITPRTVQTVFTASLARRLGGSLQLREGMANEVALIVRPG
ncbi:MAG TPA: histidine phosphotransferase family protein [Aliidongia sp.]|nr:histidine phosphotransferase family protein [Aliidongia sp.]